jgi:metal-responsive CopG/Arc/MetJ family transcriptional regulator
LKYLYKNKKSMRKKIPNEEKRRNISVTLNSDLFRMLDKYTKENNTNKSKVIQELLKKYFNLSA